jgi:hypothetical protein
MATVPPNDERAPDEQRPRPSIDDYLTTEEQARLSRVLVGVLISAAEQRRERATAEIGRSPVPLSDADLAAIYLKHGLRRVIRRGRVVLEDLGERES